MVQIKLKCRMASKGTAEGEALVSKSPIEFREVEPESGFFNVSGHELEGKNVKDKVMVFPFGCGPTTEEWALYILKNSGVAPKAIINIIAYPCSTIGAIIANIPMVYGFDKNLLEIIQSGDHVKVEASRGTVEITKKAYPNNTTL